LRDDGEPADAVQVVQHLLIGQLVDLVEDRPEVLVRVVG